MVEDAEAHPYLRQILQTCQSQEDLILAARRRGYHITRIDVMRAWQEQLSPRLRNASVS